MGRTTNQPSISFAFRLRRSAASGRLKASRTRLRRLHGGKVVRTHFSAPNMAGQVRWGWSGEGF